MISEPHFYQNSSKHPEAFAEIAMNGVSGYDACINPYRGYVSDPLMHFNISRFSALDGFAFLSHGHLWLGILVRSDQWKTELLCCVLPWNIRIFGLPNRQQSSPPSLVDRPSVVCKHPFAS